MIRSRRATNQITTLLLFLIALLVMCMGIIGGVIIYRQYAMQRWNSAMRFHSGCRIPYNTEDLDHETMLAANQEFFIEPNDDDQQETWLRILNTLYERMLGEAKEFEQNFEESLQQDSSSSSDENSSSVSKEVSAPAASAKSLSAATAEKFMQEDVDIDFDEDFSKIDVPKLVAGRDASFLHDFKAEQTGIIDKSAGRCFIMPLDREAVLPPKNLADLVIKMRAGYYNINTDVLRKNMRVKLPALTDLSSVSPRVASECKNMKTYELEKVVTGVFKRSIAAASAPQGVFSEYSGKGFNEYHFLNMDEVEANENDTK